MKSKAEGICFIYGNSINLKSRFSIFFGANNLTTRLYWYLISGVAWQPSTSVLICVEVSHKWYRVRKKELEKEINQRINKQGCILNPIILSMATILKGKGWLDQPINQGKLSVGTSTHATLDLLFPYTSNKEMVTVACIKLQVWRTIIFPLPIFRSLLHSLFCTYSPIHNAMLS